MSNTPPTSTAPPARDAIEFGAFRLDPVRRVLWRGGDVVPLTPKALDVLHALCEQPGAVVTKDELMRRVWPDTFVEEANLTVHVSALRKTLGTQPDGRPWIDTVPRRGYRYVGPPPRRVPRGPRSLAVLPFVPLDAESADDHLGLGLTDALITRLGRNGQVLVRPTSAVMPFAGTSAAASGRELSVDAALEGKVQRAGGRVRVTAQLVRVEDGATLWADTLDEPFTDLFRVQDGLAARLERALAPKLGVTAAEAAQAPTADADAYRSYLKGRYFWNKLAGPWLRKALAEFRAAVDRDPAFARAWAGLADTQVMLTLFGVASAAEGWALARQAAERAVLLDPALSEARVSLGYVKLFQDWDWAGAEEELQRAVAFSPASAEAHQWHALLLGMSGRLGDALEEVARAQELDPLSLTVNTNAGLLLYLRQQYEPEVEQHRRTLELDPDYGPAHWALGLAYAHQGRHEEAIAAHRRAVDLWEGNALFRAVLGRTYALAGRRAEAETIVRELEAPGLQPPVSPYHLAVLHALLGDQETALQRLAGALRIHDHWLTWVKVDPILDPLRGDPRFEAIVEAVVSATAR
jgi:DNA-binding winged helix-turn-helix (wHTH) protein/TolB-like protein/Flp pilus assembly protein TadD